MLDFLSDEPIFLRTHYDPDGDEKMEKWVSESEMLVDQAWWPCLNDKHYFNFGSNWQCVYEFHPEMAAPPHSRPPDNRVPRNTHARKLWE
jgi:hypothetical protein